MSAPLRTAAFALVPLAAAAAAVLIAGYCFTLPWAYGGGWISLFAGVSLYPGACGVHVLVHVRASRTLVDRPARLGLIALSHAALVAAFLLQWDLGDGPDWLILTAMMGSGPGYSDSSPPLWWPDGGIAILLNVVLFVPVAITWWTLRRV